MLCLNAPKYITLNENNQYILTDYALEHVDECCFIFKRKYSASDKYPDTYYRRCFLCRKIDADEYVPQEYEPEHKINQSKEDMQAEINAIMERLNDSAKDMAKNMKGGFAGALDYYMTRDKDNPITAEELQNRTGISTVSISNYRNNIETPIEKGTVLALCKGLYLQVHEAEHLISEAGYRIDKPTPSNAFVRILINDHMDDLWKEWVVKLIMSGISKDWIPSRNNIVKKVTDAMKEKDEVEYQKKLEDI
jgi:hypothetical protein